VLVQLRRSGLLEGPGAVRPALIATSPIMDVNPVGTRTVPRQVIPWLRRSRDQKPDASFPRNNPPALVDCKRAIFFWEC
jgi:hypothetical protein